MKHVKAHLYLLTVVILFTLILSGCSAGFSPSLLSLAPGANTSSAVAGAGPNLEAQASRPESQALTLDDFQESFVQVYENVNPSVVNIEVEVGGSGTSISGLPGGGLGSGFVWDQQGHIVTNNHVVADASRIVVNFADGSTAEAELVGRDPNSDLAVIKVSAAAEELLRPVTLADSSQVKVGQIAIAIGNPYGLSGTMTEGIVSALSRSLPVNTTAGGSSYTIPDIIQTDAAINPGNSGGVLVNAAGEVIGVTAAIRSNSDANSGIGFVIPANIVSKVVPVLIKDGRFTHTYMGISGTSLTMDLAAALELPGSQKGVVVIQVASGSPAEKAGLVGSTVSRTSSRSSAPAGSDVIIAIDGQKVNTFEDLTSYLFTNTEVGQTVTLTVLRQGREQTVELSLGALPSDTLQ